MPDFSFHYGRKNISFTLPDTLAYSLIEPNNVLPAQDAELIIQKSINHPLREINLGRYVTAASRVVIVVNDKTRPVPNHLMVPPLVEKLISLGIKKENITFLIGVGTHTPMLLEEFSKVLPQNIYNHFRVVSHNCDDTDNLVQKGITSRGTPVFVNRIFNDADLRIVVGNIEPHHFAGFSGGVKSAAIGVCGRSTITANHKFLLDPLSCAGNFDTNPLRQDIEEIGRVINVDLALNVVMNVEKKIVSCFFGKPSDVMREGMICSRRISMRQIDKPFDLVIASAGGYPKDINLYQAQKAMTHASLLLRPGGIIILAAACEEGLGSNIFEHFLNEVSSLSEVETKFLQRGFEVGSHKAIQIAMILKSHPIFLFSELTDPQVEKAYLTPVHSIEQALDFAYQKVYSLHSVAIMPFAVSTIPILKEKA